MRDIFGESRKRPDLGYDTAVNEMSAKGDKNGSGGEGSRHVASATCVGGCAAIYFPESSGWPGKAGRVCVTWYLTDYRSLSQRTRGVGRAWLTG